MMDWILTLLLLWGSLSSAADAQAELDAAQAAKVLQEERAMYGENAQVDDLISAPWALMPDTVYQGDAVLVRSSAEGEISWQHKTYPLRLFGTGYYVLLPVPMDAKPGVYSIGTAKLTVKAKAFAIDRLQVTKEQEQMKQNTDRIAADQQKINTARSNSEPAFLYKDNFIVPVEGRLTTPYGYIRYVNGKYDGSHRAVDLAAPEGTPVKAANAGKVVLAESLYLTGNSVYIDHGMNLFSQYAHLSKLLVNVGDEVAAGQVIGLVGTTGFSTGPHLHFTFWIGNDPTNPNIFFDSSPFLWNTVKGK